MSDKDKRKYDPKFDFDPELEPWPGWRFGMPNPDPSKYRDWTQTEKPKPNEKKT